jgi:uncharacterized lipoprotein NlpE involved in copper resistance
MRTARQNLKKILAVFFCVALHSSYNPVFAETTATPDTHHAQNSQDWPGIYYGFTPCTDCKGIKTTLALNKNGSYILITQYVGKSEREFTEKGKFTAGDTSNTLVLTPRNSATTRQYWVGENNLIQLDNNGNRITGKQADSYMLRRTDLTAPSQPHASH